MILWIEDDPATWRYYADILIDDGHHIVFATNPKDAIDILQEKHKQIYLIILDIIMPTVPKPDFLEIPSPIVTGLMIGEYITQEHPEIPIIIFTVINSEELRYLNNTVLSILNKSNPIDLIDTIRGIEEINKMMA